MDYIELGQSKLFASQLGFGCCPMGGYNWGEVARSELLEAVSVALDNGVNFFDTADIYGLGESEKILGQALRGRRHEAIIATKFGARMDNQRRIYYDNSPNWAIHALNESLKRLDTDYIDVYQVHYRDARTSLSEVIEVLEQQKEAGKIRYFGLSNIPFIDIHSLDLPKAMICFQAEYSLVNRLHEEDIIKMVQKKNLGFLSWGSLGQGVLSGKYDANTSFSQMDRRSKPTYVNFHGDKFKKNMVLVEKMRDMSKCIGRSLTQIAIRWILDYLGFGIALVGAKRPEQIRENAEAFGWHLSKQEVDSLNFISKNAG